ncbi:MAG TPA: hypothetical protein VFR10_06255, partial [bacterium]|nr:hypothetical protein [bacterium]
ESPHIKKLCSFSPNISYRFRNEGDSLLVLVCNGCAEASYIWDDGSLFWRVDRSNLDLIRLGLDVFPEDEILRRRLEETTARE